MKKILGLICAVLIGIMPVTAQKSAKNVLDATANAFTKGGGIEATFKVDQFNKNNQVKGSVSGVMHIKGNKFQMTTPDMITWYNGKTQWSYIKNNEEVNISTPTLEEQQSMNPYAFVYLYKKGYKYSMKETSLRGKPCYEVTLQAKNAQNSLRTVIIDIEKNNYAPLCIRLQQKDLTWTRITVQRYSTNRSYKDSDFEFNHNDFPKAEIIDLR